MGLTPSVRAGQAGFSLGSTSLMDLKTHRDTGPLLDAEQAAKHLGITPHAVSRWAQEKKIAHIKLGTARKSPLRFRRGDLDAFIGAHLIPAARQEARKRDSLKERGRNEVHAPTETPREMDRPPVAAHAVRAPKTGARS
jgi:hypothetical protein